MVQKVMVYHSGQAGAPNGGTSLHGAAGSVNSIINGCLVTGFNIQPIASISQAGGIATALTTSPQHGFQVGEFVDVSGATPAGYNGRVKVLTKTANSFSYAVADTLGAASGAMSAKYGSAGWSRPYSGNNAGVYVSEAGSLGIGVAIGDDNPYNDGGLSFNLTQMFEPTGIDSATQMGETVVHGKVYRGGWEYPNSIPALQAHGWLLVADGRTCYLILYGNIYDSSYQTVMMDVMIAFGEFASLIEDPFAHFANRGKAPNGNVLMQIPYGTSGIGPGGSSGCFPFAQPNIAADLNNLMGAGFLRSYSGLPGPAIGFPFYATRSYWNNINNNELGIVPGQQIWPGIDPASNSLPLVPIFLSERGNVIRGRMRGAFYPLGLINQDTFTNGDFMKFDETVVDAQSRRVLVSKMGVRNQSPMQIAFDISETWQ
jgi:hypothetical protein